MVVFFNYQFLIDYKGKTGTAAIVDFDEASYESFEAVMPLDVLSEWLPILVVGTNIFYIYKKMFFCFN